MWMIVFNDKIELYGESGSYVWLLCFGLFDKLWNVVVWFWGNWEKLEFWVIYQIGFNSNVLKLFWTNTLWEEYQFE